MSYCRVTVPARFSFSQMKRIDFCGQNKEKCTVPENSKFHTVGFTIIMLVEQKAHRSATTFHLQMSTLYICNICSLIL